MENVKTSSHVALGSDDDMSYRSQSTQHRDYGEIPSTVYHERNSLGKEITDDLRRHHFELGSEGGSHAWQSSSRSCFTAHKGIHRASLSVDAREDLKASHFTLDSLDSSKWESCNHADFVDYSSQAARPSITAPSAVYDNRLFPFEEATTYVTESKRALPRYVGIPRASLASGVKDDLRKSHFRSTGDEKVEFETTFSSSYKRPALVAHDRRQLAELKRDLSRSHFDFSHASC